MRTNGAASSETGRCRAGPHMHRPAGPRWNQSGEPANSSCGPLRRAKRALVFFLEPGREPAVRHRDDERLWIREALERLASKDREGGAGEADQDRFDGPEIPRRGEEKQYPGRG